MTAGMVQARALLAELQVDVAKGRDYLESVERRFGEGSAELQRAQQQHAALVTERDAASARVQALVPHVAQITRDERDRAGVALCAQCSAPLHSEQHL